MTELNIDHEMSEFGAIPEQDAPDHARAATEKNERFRVDPILHIPVVLQVVVGSRTLPVAELLRLGRGSVVPLDSRVGDPVGIMVNGREIARGEVVVIEDDSTRFGVSLTEICDAHLDRDSD